MTRTTTLHYDKSDFTTFLDTLSATHTLGYDTLIPAFEQTVGYLSTWGAGGSIYTHCKIFIAPKRGELTACYYDGTGPEARNTFVLGAVWDAPKRAFSFHS